MNNIIIINVVIWLISGFVIKNAIIILQDINVLWFLFIPLVCTIVIQAICKKENNLDDLLNMIGSVEMVKEEDEENK